MLASATLESHTAGVRSCAFSPDGKTIVSGSHDRHPQALGRTIRVPASDPRGPHDDGHCLRLLARREAIVSVGISMVLKLWDVRYGRLPCHPAGHGAPGRTPAPSRPTGGASSRHPATRPSSSGTPRRAPARRPSKGTGARSSLRLLPDGETIVSASRDETLKLWDARSGACRTTLEGHTARSPPAPSRPTVKRSSREAGTRPSGSGTRTRPPRVYTFPVLGALPTCALSPLGDRCVLRRQGWDGLHTGVDGGVDTLATRDAHRDGQSKSLPHRDDDVAPTNCTRGTPSARPSWPASP